MADTFSRRLLLIKKTLENLEHLYEADKEIEGSLYRLNGRQPEDFDHEFVQMWDEIARQLQKAKHEAFFPHLDLDIPTGITSSRNNFATCFKRNGDLVISGPDDMAEPRVRCFSRTGVLLWERQVLDDNEVCELLEITDARGDPALLFSLRNKTGILKVDSRDAVGGDLVFEHDAFAAGRMSFSAETGKLYATNMTGLPVEVFILNTRTTPFQFLGRFSTGLTNHRKILYLPETKLVMVTSRHNLRAFEENGEMAWELAGDEHPGFYASIAENGVILVVKGESVIRVSQSGEILGKVGVLMFRRR